MAHEEKLLDCFNDLPGNVSSLSRLEEQVSPSHEYTTRAKAESFAVWVPGLTIVLRRRRRSRLTRAREGGKLRASWAIFAMVAVQARSISHLERTAGRPRCQQHLRCCRCAVSSPDSSTSGRVYHYLSQGRTSCACVCERQTKVQREYK